MSVEKRIDELGRIVVPVSYRKRLGIEKDSLVKIDLDGDVITLTNDKITKTRKEIEDKLKELKKSGGNNDYTEALKWVLNEKD